MTEFEQWKQNNSRQLEQDFIDDYDDMFEEYCRAKFDVEK